MIANDFLEENKKWLQDGTINFLIGQDAAVQGHSPVMILFQLLFDSKKPEQDIADNEDSEEIADIEEPETKEEEIFFDSGEDAIKAEESGTASIGYSKNASVDDVSIISEPKKKNYDFGVYSTDIDLTAVRFFQLQ